MSAAMEALHTTSGCREHGCLPSLEEEGSMSTSDSN
jgi:hypothetical protein